MASSEVVRPDVQVEEVDLNKTEVFVGGERLTEERAEELADRFERATNLIPRR